jgi:hypothetical protein
MAQVWPHDVENCTNIRTSSLSLQDERLKCAKRTSSDGAPAPFAADGLERCSRLHAEVRIHSLTLDLLARAATWTNEHEDQKRQSIVAHLRLLPGFKHPVVKVRKLSKYHTLSVVQSLRVCHS